MPEAIEVRRISAAPDSITIEWAQGAASEFPSLWLLDNRSEDRDAHSGQRLIDIADLPESPRIRTAVTRDGTVQIEWEGEAQTACFSLAWLAAHADERSGRAPEEKRHHWLEGAPHRGRRVRPAAAASAS